MQALCQPYRTMTPAPSAATWPDLLRSAASVLGIDLTPDDTGYLALVVDAQCTVQLQCTDDGRHATLFAVIGQPTSEAVARLAPRLLAANLFWQDTGGATLGHDPVSGRLLLARALAIEPFLARGSAQAAHECVAELQAFADQALGWQARLSDWLDGAQEESSDPSATPASTLTFMHRA